jgi:hypothetical protein
VRDLIQAKKAFEEAKEAQDADKVGRILTYVEGRLKPEAHGCLAAGAFYLQIISRSGSGPDGAVRMAP